MEVEFNKTWSVQESLVDYNPLHCVLYVRSNNKHNIEKSIAFVRISHSVYTECTSQMNEWERKWIAICVDTVNVGQQQSFVSSTIFGPFSLTTRFDAELYERSFLCFDVTFTSNQFYLDLYLL